MELKDQFRFTMSPEFFDSTTIFTAKLMDNGDYKVTWDNGETTYEPSDLQRYLENGIIREDGDS